MKKLLLPLVSILMVSGIISCTSLRELPTYWQSEIQSDTIKPTGFDAATKIGWLSYNDSTHLYFAVNIFDPMVQMAVMRNGLTIFLDTTKKMKEDQFVQFPITKLGKPPARSTSFAEKRRNPGNQGTPMEQMFERIEGLEMIWHSGGLSAQFNPSLESNEFITAVALDSMNILNLLIGVPLDELNDQGIDGMSDFYVGLGVTFSGNNRGRGQAVGQGGGQRLSGGAVTGGSGGGGGRGGRGGGRGGGGGGAQMGGGGRPGGMNSSSPVVEKFWYQTKIAKK